MLGRTPLCIILLCVLFGIFAHVTTTSCVLGICSPLISDSMLLSHVIPGTISYLGMSHYSVGPKVQVGQVESDDRQHGLFPLGKFYWGTWVEGHVLQADLVGGYTVS